MAGKRLVVVVKEYASEGDGYYTCCGCGSVSENSGCSFVVMIPVYSLWYGYSGDANVDIETNLMLMKMMMYTCETVTVNII